MAQGAPVGRVDVRLVRYGLDIYKRSLRGTLQTNILEGVSTVFEAGKLNGNIFRLSSTLSFLSLNMSVLVIMGPSGCGKSSLLNLMALRNRSSLSARYKSSGIMLFNGVVPAEEDVHSLVSYVTQDDGGLLPYLTVREMLHTSAGLRLPKTMDKKQKIAKAEEIIANFGLKDCADNLIGDEMIKGISGGEKRYALIQVTIFDIPLNAKTPHVVGYRRVSIAIQVLTDPTILM